MQFKAGKFQAHPGQEIGIEVTATVLQTKGRGNPRINTVQDLGIDM